MSKITFIDVNELNELEGDYAFALHQLDMAMKEIERLNARIREYEKDDKVKKGSK